jgi:hypothetical protein
MKEDLISRDECRQRVGKAFYQQGLIGRASDQEFNLRSEHGPEIRPLTAVEIIDGAETKPLREFEIIPPSPPEIADELALAIGRNVIAETQGRTIDHWLALYGFDPERESFSRTDFEAAMSGLLGQAIDQVRTKILGPSQIALEKVTTDKPQPATPLDQQVVLAPQPAPESVTTDKPREPLAAQMAAARKGRGRPPEERDRILNEMKANIAAGKTSRAEMQEMNQEALAAAYNSKHRQTAQDALAELLLENQYSESIGISGISGTK